MENSEQQAHTQLESIVAMIAALRTAAGDEQREAAETRIQEDPLSVEVRADWHAVGAEQSSATEFRIELCTGGPAVRIIGDLSLGHTPRLSLPRSDGRRSILHVTNPSVVFNFIPPLEK